ncbi:MAG TPA: NmrA/HSCARG family protein [Rhodothermales bacterium]|nr:NmrA/HSCARG family protein [Rhodothermales bacterium]
MSEKKIIAVIGATGAQGGGLVRAILGDPDGGFAARGITRNPDGDKAKALADQGAEVVFGDLDDEKSLERAFSGAYGAFCVTNFWEHFSPEKELGQAKNMAAAAAAANLQHVIWSSLDDTRDFVPLDDDRMPTLMEKYKVPHFDAKGEANRLFTESVPTTVLNTAFYWENFIYFGSGPAKDQNGNYALTFPLGDAKMPSIAAEDIGKCAYGIFKRGNEFIGKEIGIAGGHVSGSEMASALTKALGVDIRYNNVDPDVFRGFGFPGAEDVGNMFQFKRDFEDQYRASRSVDLARRLNPDLMSFDQWVSENAHRIPLS